MAPYYANIKATLVDTLEGGKKKVYEANLDPTWNIGNVPHGGYVLGQVLEACLAHQSSTPHVDPLHISAHFMRPASTKVPLQTHIKVLKTGAQFTNLGIEVIQNGAIKVLAHAVFGINGPTPGDETFLLKGTPWERRHPLYTHPSEAEVTKIKGPWGFHDAVIWAYDKAILAKNAPDHPNRTNGSTVGGGGAEWGGWITFRDETEKATNPYIPFLGDTFQNTVLLLPGADELLPRSWFPTITLALDFRFPISQLDPSKHSLRTFGIYSFGNWTNYPSGRHDVNLEIWTAPCDIGQGKPDPNWRDGQICLATCTQVTLVVPAQKNFKNDSKPQAKAKPAKL